MLVLGYSGFKINETRIYSFVSTVQKRKEKKDNHSISKLDSFGTAVDGSLTILINNQSVIVSIYFSNSFTIYLYHKCSHFSVFAFQIMFYVQFPNDFDKSFGI